MVSHPSTASQLRSAVSAVEAVGREGGGTGLHHRFRFWEGSLVLGWCFNREEQSKPTFIPLLPKHGSPLEKAKPPHVSQE